jgi:8-oxo-dGTP pyrophosphatase MutT (NUDIX family)
VYFAAYDPAARKVFIGHHRKSGFWLFNGGHIDRGETPADAVVREIDEEWGLKNVAVDVHHPQLMTITEIDNPLKQTCTRHYDFWYFLPFDHTQVRFDADKLGKEFQVSAWLTIPEAIERSTDPATLQALAYIDEQLLRL